MTELIPTGNKNIPNLADRVLPDSVIRFKPEEILEKLKTMDPPVYDGVSNSWTGFPDTSVPGKEIELAKFLNNLADIVRRLVYGEGFITKLTDLVYSAEYKDSAPAGGDINRKPDLVVRIRDAMRTPPKEAHSDWELFLAAGELKSNGNDPEERVFLQLAENVRHFFRHQRGRRFVLAIGFFNGRVSLHVYDRSGGLISQRFDVHDAPEAFLRIAIGILLIEDRKYLGYDTSFSTDRNGEEFITVKETRKVDELDELVEVKYKVIQELFFDRVIRGRGTWTLLVERTIDQKLFVLKDSWVDRSREMKECEILEDIKGIRGVVQMEAHELLKVANPYEDEIANDSTENVRKDVSEIDEKGQYFEKEIRDHHRIVMTPFGVGLVNFSSRMNLLSAMKDYIQTILELRKRNIVHRDISLRNLILADLEKRGCIIDFDYAINVLKHSKLARGGRSGTVPFMAIDVLSDGTDIDFEHKYYHDLESLLYVLIWICVTRGGPYDTDRSDDDFDFDESILGQWSPLVAGDKELRIVADIKQATMTYPAKFAKRILSIVDVYFECLKDTLEELRCVLFPETSDEKRKIYDGSISADELCGRLIAILDKAMQKDAVRKEVPLEKLDHILQEKKKKKKATAARRKESQRTKLRDIAKENIAKEKQAAKAAAAAKDGSADTTTTEGEEGGSSRSKGAQLRKDAIRNNMRLKRTRENDASDSGYASGSTMVKAKSSMEDVPSSLEDGLADQEEQEEQEQERARVAKRARSYDPRTALRAVAGKGKGKEKERND